MRARIRAMACGLLLMPAGLAWAQVEGLPAPDLIIKPPRGDEFRLLEHYKHHIIVLVYWNSMDSTSVDLFPMLNELHDKYRHRGVAILAPTREKHERAWRTMQAKEAKFVGIFGIYPERPYRFPAPRTAYIIDPYGRIAHARFDAADNLEERIQTQLRKTPPPAATEQHLNQQLATVQALMAAQDYGRAYTLAERLREFFEAVDGDEALRVDSRHHGGRRRDPRSGASDNPGLNQAEGLLVQILEASKQWLTQAREEIRKEDYEAACRKLAGLSVRLTKPAAEEDQSTRRDRSSRSRRTTDRRRDIDHRRSGQTEAPEVIRDFEELKEHVDHEIGRLQGDAYTKSIISKALDNVRGEVQNDLAAELLGNGMYLEAISLYRDTADKYPGTEAAEVALTAMKNVYVSPQLREQIEQTLEVEQATRWYDLAERFARCELFDQAREYFDKVIRHYPDSTAAERARQRLAGLADEQQRAEARRRAREAGG